MTSRSTPTRALKFSILAAIVSFAGALPAENELEGMRLKYEVKREVLAKPIAQLRERYTERLEALQKKFRDTGELGAVLNLRAAIKSAAKGEDPTEIATDPAELGEAQRLFIELKEKRQLEVQAGTSRLMAAYGEQLATLRADLTKAGDVKEATAVDAEIKAIAAELKDLEPIIEDRASPELASMPFEEWLKTVRFRLPDGEFRYVAGSLMAHATPEGRRMTRFRPAITEIDSKKRTVTWRYTSGATQTITVSIDRLTAKSKNSKRLREEVTIVPHKQPTENK